MERNPRRLAPGTVTPGPLENYTEFSVGAGIVEQDLDFLNRRGPGATH